MMKGKHKIKFIYRYYGTQNTSFRNGSKNAFSILMLNHNWDFLGTKLPMEAMWSHKSYSVGICV